MSCKMKALTLALNYGVLSNDQARLRRLKQRLDDNLRERALLLREIDELCERMGHMEKIVAMLGQEVCDASV